MSGVGKLPLLALEAPRPWGPWKKGPVPREWPGDDARLRAYGKRGYLAAVERTWENGWYAVMIAPMEVEGIGTVEHVMIVNVPNTPVRSWRDMQRIKNELFGEARVAVEVFPAQGDVIDAANMTHLWVMPAGWTLPFGLQRYPELAYAEVTR